MPSLPLGVVRADVVVEVGAPGAPGDAGVSGDPGGAGGHGGDGESKTATADGPGDFNQANAGGGRGGDGGAGGAGIDGLDADVAADGGTGGDGGNGGNVRVESRTVANSTSQVRARAAGVGGPGGAAGAGGAPAGSGARGRTGAPGRGGNSYATALAENTHPGGHVDINISSDAGKGGSGFETGGQPGTAELGPVIATGHGGGASIFASTRGGDGGDARATDRNGARAADGSAPVITGPVRAAGLGHLQTWLFASGGNGGDAIGTGVMPAVAGNGAATTLVNVAGVQPRPPTEFLQAGGEVHQLAAGGRGGSAENGTAGTGGNATSNLTSPLPRDIMDARFSAATYPGGGGRSTATAAGLDAVGGVGGDGAARVSVTAARLDFGWVHANVSSGGGTGGEAIAGPEAGDARGGQGGNGFASAIAVNPANVARASASVSGGSGGSARSEGAGGAHGGAPGTFEMGSVRATGRDDVEVRAEARGGWGGEAHGFGAGPAVAAAGAPVSLTDVVSGTLQGVGGRLRLEQGAEGGAGGASTNGAPGAGGDASSSLTRASPATTFEAEVWAVGGGGGNATATAVADGSTVRGAVGGRAISHAAATGNAAAGFAPLVTVTVRATGGAGGNVDVGATGRSGAGGHGGAAVGSADVINRNGWAVAEVTATGGTGGEARAGGNGTVSAGHGGAAGLTRVRATGATDARAAAVAVGGKGGDAVRDTDATATAGDGAPVSLLNVTEGEVVGAAGALTLSQRATGGHGGRGTNIRTGRGGDASSVLDRPSARGGSTWTIDASAVGGTGGRLSRSPGVAGNGGAATAGTNVVADPSVVSLTAKASATGGGGGSAAGGGPSGLGGNARATARGTVVTGTADVSAEATGGSSNTGAGAAVAEAVADSLSNNTAQPVALRARATARSGIGPVAPGGATARAATTSTGGGPVTSNATAAATAQHATGQLTATAAAAGPGAMSAGAVGSAGSAPASSQAEAAAGAGVLWPSEATVAQALAGNPRVSAAVPAGGLALAYFQAAASETEARTGPATFTLMADLSVTRSAIPATDMLVLGALDPSVSGDGITSVRFEVLKEGRAVLERTFASEADAVAFFDDNLMSFGRALEGVTGTLDLSVRLAVTTDGSVAAFGGDFLVAAVPEPAALGSAVSVIGWIALRRRTRRGNEACPIGHSVSSDPILL